MRATRTWAIAMAIVLASGIATVGCSSDEKADSKGPSTTVAEGEKGIIRVGGIFGRTVTPDPDIGAYEAVDSFFQKINEQGGINGYTFEFEGVDDQGDPAKFAAAVERLTDSGVDVIISSAQTEVPGGIAQIEKTGIPYIGGDAHGRDILETPNVFPTGANLQNGIAAVFQTLLADSDGVSVTAVNHPSVAPAVDGVVERLKDADVDVDKTGTFELTETDFTGIAAQIRDTGDDDAIIYALNSQQPGIVGALEQQGYKGSIYSGSYDAGLIGQLGSYADGRFFSVQPWAALDSGKRGKEAKSIVEERYSDIDLLANRKAMDAWTSAEILVGAVEELGDAKVTKESIIDALNSLTDFKTTFMAPVTYKAGPEGHLDVSNCMQALAVEGGKWVVAGDSRFTCWDDSVAPQ